MVSPSLAVTLKTILGIDLCSVHLVHASVHLHSDIVILLPTLVLDLRLVRLVNVPVILCTVGHAVHVVLRQTSPLVCDVNLFGRASGLVLSGDVQDLVGVTVEGDSNLFTPCGAGGIP